MAGYGKEQLDILGQKTDTPSTDAEGATARTLVSLLKGIKNYMRVLSGGVATATLRSPVGGSKTVAATGTAEPLVAASTRALMLYVRAKSGNTNNVYFGDSAVDKTTSQQVILDSDEWVTIAAPPGFCLDVHEFYIDVDTNGEGVDFLYL